MLPRRRASGDDQAHAAASDAFSELLLNHRATKEIKRLATALACRKG